MDLPKLRGICSWSQVARIGIESIDHLAHLWRLHRPRNLSIEKENHRARRARGSQYTEQRTSFELLADYFADGRGIWEIGIPVGTGYRKQAQFAALDELGELSIGRI